MLEKKCFIWQLKMCFPREAIKRWTSTLFLNNHYIQPVGSLKNIYKNSSTNTVVSIIPSAAGWCTSLAVHLFHPPPGTVSMIAALLAFTHKFMWLIPRRAQKWSHPQLMNNSVPKQLLPSCVGFACFPVCLRGIPPGLSLSPPTLRKHAARPEWTL